MIESQRGVLSWFSIVKFEFGIKRKFIGGWEVCEVWNRFRQPQNTSFQIGLGVSDP